MCWATTANPERSRTVRTFSGLRRPTGESARAFRRAGATRAPSDGAHGRLGAGKTAANAGRKKPSGTVTVWLAAEREWRAGYLSSNVDALPHGELEPGGKALPPGAVAEFRCRAHLRTLRSAGSGGCRCLRPAKPAVRRRADRGVPAHWEGSMGEADVSRALGTPDAPRGKPRGCPVAPGNDT